MARLVLGTSNAAKVPMLRAFAEGLEFEVVVGANEDTQPSGEEQAATHLAIAVRKAIDWSVLHPDAVILVSDGGIAIPSLGNAWESRLTRRHTGGAQASDEARARRLLGMMKGLEDSERIAFRVEAVAVMHQGALAGAWEAAGAPCRISHTIAPSPAQGPKRWLDFVLVTEAGRRWWEMTEDEMRSAGEPWQQLTAPVSALLRRIMG